MKEIVFYYDIICPYANLASKLIEDVARRNQAKLIWRPVLLGGIYKETKKENVELPDNKMIKTYSNEKRRTLALDLAMQYARHNVKISSFKVPDIRTLNAMRLIALTPDECGPLRRNLTHVLFDAIWIQQKDVSDVNVLQGIADGLDMKIKVNEFVINQQHPVKKILRENTNEAVKRGAFGVPSFWMNEKLHFGVDRMFFMENELGNVKAQPHRLLNAPINKERKKLTFYFDYASPWSYIGFKRLPNLLKEMDDLGVEVDIEYVPLSIGGLFNMIGSPMLPMMSMGENKRNFYSRDMNDWLKYCNLPFQFNTNFPLRTILPLRMTLLQLEHKLIDSIYEAAWADNQNLTDEKILREIVEKAGYEYDYLFSQANQLHIKQKLKDNTNRAFEAGICGLPSFQVDDGPIVFGQDRMNVVADMLLGWKFESPFNTIISKL